MRVIAEDGGGKRERGGRVDYVSVEEGELSERKEKRREGEKEREVGVRKKTREEGDGLGRRLKIFFMSIETLSVCLAVLPTVWLFTLCAYA